MFDLKYYQKLIKNNYKTAPLVHMLITDEYIMLNDHITTDHKKQILQQKIPEGGASARHLHGLLGPPPEAVLERYIGLPRLKSFHDPNPMTCKVQVSVNGHIFH